ncbi:MAG TPA: histidine phosphatase family protein [Polyangiaceae bacterium]
MRHGATVLSAEDRFAGSTDVDLSEIGKDQARSLGARLATEPLSAVYASPLRRVRDTAAFVADPHGLEPIVRDGLREIAHGRWEGLTRADVEARFHDEYAAWDADPLTFAPQGGESGIAVLARALPVLREIVESCAGKVVAVVSHKATIRLLLCSVLGIDARGYRDRLDQSPACLNVVDFKDPVHARLMLFNDTSHYAAQPRRAEAQLSKWWSG